MVKSGPERVRVNGPLAPFADGFCAHLAKLGYQASSARSHLELLADVSRWMDAEGLDIPALMPRAVERFLVDRRRRGRRSGLSPNGLRPLLDYMCGLGVLPAVEEFGATAVDQLVGRFCAYLLDERGLAPGSVRLYARVASRFLGERPKPLTDALGALAASDVYAFVLRESRRVQPRTAETVVCALRALLRFLHVQGSVAMPLAEAVPSVAQRREDLPRALPAGDVKLLLDSCDRATAVGCRDYAILALLARLGLRAGEVAALELDDVDWRAAELVVHGKRCRIDRLPLPHDVGEALADYLSRARPPGFGRTVFLRAKAPLVGLSGDGVSEVVHRGCVRAGVAPVRAHRLRHTVATELLRRGAGLPEIGQVLRHQSFEATAVYAKVDREALSGLALPWPGAGS
ncbi:MAG: site-specific integrase [Actinobacteria bacterium]|nr:site-specific integrase [Actinomycetota bacterium]